MVCFNMKFIVFDSKLGVIYMEHHRECSLEEEKHSLIPVNVRSEQ